MFRSSCGATVMTLLRHHQFVRMLGFLLLSLWTWIDHRIVAAQNTTSSSTYPDCSGYAPFIGDAVCDEQNNNVECGYDGGDCCICTCVDSPSAFCGLEADFNCTDPNVAGDCGITPSPAATFGYPNCTENLLYDLQNGYCDHDLNNEECGYDGGDCCSCTCRDTGYYDSCGMYGYDCLDPNAPTDCPTPTPTFSPAAAVGFPGCTGYMSNLQNGYCNWDLNNEKCGYDLGDCCRCTCNDGISYDCGEYGFDCVDPTAPTDCDSASPTPSPAAALGYPNCIGALYNLQDGYCNYDLNTEECGYDLGDCCRCTCIDGIYYNCGEYGFNCSDPTASTDCPTPSPTPSPAASLGYPDCAGDMYGLQNGFCDWDLNSENCGYDGGDCCRCTCTDGIYYDCGEYGFNCVDPTASTDCPTPSPTLSPAAALGYPDCVGSMYNLENGYCDLDLNNENCGYDGGDCCRCTCQDGVSYDCGDYGFDCVDPTASTDCPTPGPTPSPASGLGHPDCTGDMSDLKNGNCDWDLNNEQCGYDGGDCCRCTCEDGIYYDCDDYDFYCVDPTAPTDCPTPSPAGLVGYPNCSGDMSDLQNGHCDWDLNNDECGYDGGDCCSCTCEDSIGYDCGEHGFDCLDPTAPTDCSASSSISGQDYPDCTGDMSDLQNGNCNWDLNNEECGYDGGDCCECTCTDNFGDDEGCGLQGYNCLQPNACEIGNSSWILFVSVTAILGCVGACCVCCGLLQCGKIPKWRAQPAVTQGAMNPVPRSPPPAYNAPGSEQEREIINATPAMSAHQRTSVFMPTEAVEHPEQVNVIHTRVLTYQGGQRARVVMPWGRRAPPGHVYSAAIPGVLPQPSGPPEPHQPKAVFSIPRGETPTISDNKWPSRIAALRRSLFVPIGSASLGPTKNPRQTKGRQLAVTGTRRPSSSRQETGANESKRVELAITESRRVQTITEAIIQQENYLSQHDAPATEESGTGGSPAKNFNVKGPGNAFKKRTGNGSDWDRETYMEEKIPDEDANLGAKDDRQLGAAVVKIDGNIDEHEDIMAQPIGTILQEEENCKETLEGDHQAELRQNDGGEKISSADPREKKLASPATSSAEDDDDTSGNLNEEKGEKPDDVNKEGNKVSGAQRG